MEGGSIGYGDGSYSNILSAHKWRTTGVHLTLKGFKAGDPLSPYLFLLCVEGLYSLIRKAVETKHLHGILSCKNGVCISHLLFVDDSLIFCQATKEEGQHLLNILERNEAVSGQAINRHKTSIFFSRNTRDLVKTEI